MQHHIASQIAGDKLCGAVNGPFQVAARLVHGALYGLAHVGHGVGQAAADVPQLHAVVTFQQHVIDRFDTTCISAHAQLCKLHMYGITQAHPLQQGLVGIFGGLFQLGKAQCQAYLRHAHFVCGDIIQRGLP